MSQNNLLLWDIINMMNTVRQFIVTNILRILALLLTFFVISIHGVWKLGSIFAAIMEYLNLPMKLICSCNGEDYELLKQEYGKGYE